jgi:cysteine desulfurase/selenocysteine lyase
LLFGQYESEQGITPQSAEPFSKCVKKRTKILALGGVSNVLGTIHPIEEISKAARSINPNVVIVLDAAQMVAHVPLDVAKLDVDFAAFSGHKVFGPTGIGVLWGRKELMNSLPPFTFGGEMIEEVKTTGATFKKTPYRFEAGTPPIASAIALKAALWYLSDCNIKKVRDHEKELTQYALSELTNTFGEHIHILGPEKLDERVGVIAFTFGNYHPHDIAQILDEEHIAVRAGHHCAQPLHEALGIPASTRASLSVFNTKDDVDALVVGLRHVQEKLGK